MADADLEYGLFTKRILDLVGIDLGLYKPAQMRRRLNALIVRNGAANLLDLYRSIARDPKKQQEFRDFVTINVSEFFRVPDRFEYLRTHLLPALAARPHSNIWSAGCSNGAEPYSLAILLHEISPYGRWRILATDIDRSILKVADTAIYDKQDLNNVSNDLLLKYFRQEGSRYRLVDRIRSRVDFKELNLLKDGYPADVDLIVCRHVLIYFTQAGKDEICHRFANALRPGGVLFIGSEVIRAPRDLGFESLSVSFYRRLEALGSKAS